MASSTSSISLSTTSSSALGTTHLSNLVSGLDVDALVSAQILADSIPLTLLQNTVAKLTAQKSDYQTLETDLQTLQYALQDLTYSTAFSTRTATSSDEKVVTASTKTGASAGSYSINVSQLATTSSVTGTALSSFNDGTKATLTGNVSLSGYNGNDSTALTSLGITPGTVTINGASIVITSGDTINTVLNKISASSAGVTATLNSSTGDVVLTQKTAGSSDTITLGSDGGTNLFNAFGLSSGNGTLVAGQDATDAQTLTQVFGSSLQAGYFSINGTVFQVNPTTDTLDSILSEINSSTTAGVQAFYNSTSKTVSIVSTTAGSQGSVTLGTYGSGGTDSSNLLDLLKVTTAGGNTPAVTTGTDASVTVNGVAVAANGNSITMNGNTFALQGAGTATVTVSTNYDAIITKVQNVVTQYNSVVDAINAKIQEAPSSSSDSSSSASTGDLHLDPFLEGIIQDLGSFSSTVLNSPNSVYQTLSQVGITTGDVGQSVTDSELGHLSLNTDTLKTALETNMAGVESLFGNTTVYVDSEKVGTSSSSQLTYSLAHGDITGTPTVMVGSKQYTVVTAAQLSTDDTNAKNSSTTIYECSVDATTGKITFATGAGTFPNGSQITVSYNYTNTTGGSGTGIFSQMQAFINTYTTVGGQFDTMIGSNGSLTDTISYDNDRVSEMQDRINNEQSSLYTYYNNMLSQLQTLSSENTMVSALLSGLSSSSSSSSKG
ncbi:Hypothetical protein LUCI_4732 [Lucifera butyrica]|uniref:Flagellar hook-associated protein 2 n=1 Tax=Lucifera butyrica TaxID=1351585 RepID=A0A498RH78_9FIRM|nr:flagellar filament capping protein FliD [Lucifera butyrica]VBB09442.1 Hypothetical protein LUCI_4732 [Lucifera butyrica]